MAPRYDRDNAKEREILQVGHHIIVENDAYFQWIESVLEEKIPTKDFEVVLKDGTILCRLMNKIQPGSIKKFRETVIFSFHFNKLICSSLGHSLHAHGEYPGLPLCRQEVWSPRRGAVSDCRPVREKEPPPGVALSLLPRQTDPAAPWVPGAQHWA